MEFDFAARGEINLDSGAQTGLAWFCLRAQAKHEHIVAANLRAIGVEVFLPRIRFRRSTRMGTAWVTEALFPGYLFARFDGRTSLRRVQAVHGARGVVRFGDQFPEIPERVIGELRQVIGTNDPQIVSRDYVPGESVEIADGTLRGLRAVVLQVMPSRDRVAVLLEFLGQQLSVEVATQSILQESDERNWLLPKASFSRA